MDGKSLTTLPSNPSKSFEERGGNTGEIRVSTQERDTAQGTPRHRMRNTEVRVYYT